MADYLPILRYTKDKDGNIIYMDLLLYNKKKSLYFPNFVTSMNLKNEEAFSYRTTNDELVTQYIIRNEENLMKILEKTLNERFFLYDSEVKEVKVNLLGDFLPVLEKAFYLPKEKEKYGTLYQIKLK